MAHITPTLASVFCYRPASTSWSKLKDDHKLSQLCSKYWGNNIEDEAKQWHSSHSTVKVDRDNDIGPDSHVLDLGIGLRGSKLLVRQDYVRIYYYSRKRHEEGLSSEAEEARSVVITGQPGIGVFLSSVVSCALFNNPCVKR